MPWWGWVIIGLIVFYVWMCFVTRGAALRALGGIFEGLGEILGAILKFD